MEKKSQKDFYFMDLILGMNFPLNQLKEVALVD